MDGYDSQAWRLQTLWKPANDLAFKHGIATLKRVYIKFTGKFATPSQPRYMSHSEFTDLITAAEVYSENFGYKACTLHYNLAMQTQVDEITVDFPKHLNMTFIEFVEAIARVAECLEVPHPLEVSEFTNSNLISDAV